MFKNKRRLLEHSWNENDKLDSEHETQDIELSQIERVDSPLQLEFNNIKFTAPGKRKKDPSKVILNGVSGVARPGRLLAILGASGSGKTSLLSILAGRVRSHGKLKVTGEILLNHEVVSAKVFEQHCAYVMQHDLFLETLTPREAITNSALLRMSKTIPRETKLEKVETILKALGLTKCANTYVGGHMIKGISGGEQRRTSIGIELVTSPKLLFVDEPTSGLDSVTAMKTMNLLTELAHVTERTVIATIHQPNSAMFHAFDDLMLLTEGNIVYLGPASEAVEHFAALGYECPPLMNPADYLVDLIHVDTHVEKDVEKMEQLTKHQKEKYNANRQQGRDSIFERALRPLEELSTERPGMAEQVRILTKRSFQNFYRAPTVLRLRLLQTVVFSALLGIIFFQVKIDGTPQTIQSRTGALFFCGTNSTIGAIVGVILTFPLEKCLFVREHSNGMYSTPAYFLSKIATELPFQLLFSLLFASVNYPMVGFTMNFGFFYLTLILDIWHHVVVLLFSLLFASVNYPMVGFTMNFGFFYLTLILAMMTGYSLGLMLGALAPTAEVASGFMGFILMPLLLFTGFFIKPEEMQDWISWLTYIDFVRYITEILIVLEYNENFVVDGVCLPVTGKFCTGPQILKYFGYESVDVGAWVGVLLTFFTGQLVLACLILSFQTKVVSRSPLTHDASETSVVVHDGHKGDDGVKESGGPDESSSAYPKLPPKEAMPTQEQQDAPSPQGEAIAIPTAPSEDDEVGSASSAPAELP